MGNHHHSRWWLGGRCLSEEVIQHLPLRLLIDLRSWLIEQDDARLLTEQSVGNCEELLLTDREITGWCVKLDLVLFNLSSSRLWWAVER